MWGCAVSSVVTRWRARLAIRRSLLAAARRRAAYWRTQKRRAKKGTARYSRAAYMLAKREREVAKRKEQVAYAERVIARHSSATSLSQKGAEFIASWEGFSSRPYRDAVGVWTIGYGSTKGVGPNTPPITREQALARLKREVDEVYGAAVARTAKAVGLSLKQHEFDALTSLVYNCGPGILDRGRTMGDALRSRDRRRIADAFLVYDKAGGQTLPGLVRRRRAERKLFLS